MKFSASLLVSVLAVSASARHIDGGSDCRTEANTGTLKCCKFTKTLSRKIPDAGTKLAADYKHVTICYRAKYSPLRLEWLPFLNCADVGLKCELLSAE